MPFAPDLDKEDNMRVNWAAEYVAKEGNLESLQILYSTGVIHAGKIAAIAANFGHLEILRWMYLVNPQSVLNNSYSSVIFEACGSSNIKLVQWLISIGHRIDEYCYYNAARYGRKEMLQWLFTNGPIKKPTSTMFRNAALGGHVFIMQYLHSLDPHIVLGNNILSEHLTAFEY